MALFIVTEQDSDGDISEIFGPFESIETGMIWLRNIYVPKWIKDYEDQETGYKANVGFFGNGASDGTTCTRWVCRNVLPLEKA